MNSGSNTSAQPQQLPPPIQAKKRGELERAQAENNNRKSDAAISRYAMGDLLIIDQAIASGLDYIVKNPTASDSAIEKGLVQTMATIENVKSSLPMRTFLGLLAIELPAAAAAGAYAGVKLSPADQSVFKRIGGDAQAYLDGIRKKNAAPLKESLQKCVDLINRLVEAAPTMKTAVESTLLAPPYFADIKNAYAARLQINVGDETDNSVAVASSLFVTSFLVGIALALFFWGGSLAANSVAWRSAAYRVLYFIWGGLFFIFTIPYYLIYVKLVRAQPLPDFAGAIPLVEVIVKTDEERAAEAAAAATEEAGEATLVSTLLFPWRLFKGLFGWVSPFLFQYTKNAEFDNYTDSAQAAWDAETAAVAPA